jgi:PIN domain nuclease of toxin-antitoxin system
MKIHLDTHIVLWLYDKLEEKFNKRIRKLIDQNALAISPIIRLELQFLKEINRVNEEANVIIDYLSERIGLEIEDIAFDIIMKTATKIIWTRDPFDRIIIATSQVKNSTLITADQNILNNYQNAIW